MSRSTLVFHDWALHQRHCIISLIPEAIDGIPALFGTYSEVMRYPYHRVIVSILIRFKIYTKEFLDSGGRILNTALS